jgi:hypothetical protein
MYDALALQLHPASPVMSVYYCTSVWPILDECFFFHFILFHFFSSPILDVTTIIDRRAVPIHLFTPCHLSHPLISQHSPICPGYISTSASTSCKIGAPGFGFCASAGRDTLPLTESWLRNGTRACCLP